MPQAKLDVTKIRRIQPLVCMNISGLQYDEQKVKEMQKGRKCLLLVSKNCAFGLKK